MPTITSTATIVASSGINAATHQVQLGTASALTGLASFGPFIYLDAIRALDPSLSMTEKILAPGGTSQTEKVVVSSGIESTATVGLIAFEPSFSRSQSLFAVIGTSGTAERFYDRSPFLFTDSEIDPNLMRDFSEAQQFMVFTRTSIGIFDSFNRVPSNASIISVKGESFYSGFLSDNNLIPNGSFESDLSSWNSSLPNGTLEIRTSPPPGVLSSLSPTEGNKYLYTKKETTTSGIISLNNRFGTHQPITSNLLERFSFDVAIGTADANKVLAVYLRFLSGDTQTYLHRYTFSGLGIPSNSELPSFLISHNTTVPVPSLTTGAFSSVNRLIYTDIQQTSFTFDTVEIWLVWDINSSAAIETLFDNIKLIANVPEDHLLNTFSVAHILNNYPVSGTNTGASDTETINQTDAFPPFFGQESPAPGSTFNSPTNKVVAFHVQDNGSDINQGSISVFIDGIQIVTAGTVLTSATWPIGSKTVISNRDISYSFERATNFTQQATVTVSGNFSDLASPSQGGFDVYTFKMLGSGTLGASITGLADGTPPSIIPLEPEDLDTQISPNTHIQWRISDNASVINPNSVRLFINDELVLQNDVALKGSFSRVSNSVLGFDYDYTPETAFGFNQTITGTVIAVDTAIVPNTGTHTYQFSTSPDDTLHIINFFLGDEQSALLTSDTLGSVEVVDFTYGLASGTSNITINGEAVPGLITTYSGSGPDRILFTWPFEQLVDFTEDLLITVHAENKFPGPFPVIKEQTFRIQPGYDVLWPNTSLDGSGGPETTFPYLTNVLSNAQVQNLSTNFSTGSEFLKFFTEDQAKANLGAFIESNIKVSDLGATIVALNPYFEYGKLMTLEIDVDDLAGNQLRFVHQFRIQNKPQ